LQIISPSFFISSDCSLLTFHFFPSTLFNCSIVLGLPREMPQLSHRGFLRVHKLRHAFRFSVIIDAGEDTRAFGNQQADARPDKFITMFDFCRGYFCAFGYQFQFLIVVCRPAILDEKFRDDHIKTFSFKVFVSKTVGAEKFGPAHLEIDWKDTMMDNAGLVGLAVPRNDGYRIRLNRCLFRKFHIRRGYHIGGKIQDIWRQKTTPSGKNSVKYWKIGYLWMAKRYKIKFLIQSLPKLTFE